MKHTTIVLIDFFEVFGCKIESFNLKLTVKGQVEYATGSLTPAISNPKIAEKCFRKKIVSTDYRFCNTILDFEDEGSKFIITSK